MPTLYVNGRYVPESRARISADDNALAWGVGLFEVLRAYNGNPFRLADHVTRLRRSAKHFGLKARLPNFPRVIDTLLKRNRLRQVYVRIPVTEGGSVIVAPRRWQPPPPGVATRVRRSTDIKPSTTTKTYSHERMHTGRAPSTRFSSASRRRSSKAPRATCSSCRLKG